MNKAVLLKAIEEKVGTSLPTSYREFLLSGNTDRYPYKSFPRVLENGFKMMVQIEQVTTIDNFIKNNANLDFVLEFEEDDELPDSFVEGKYLFQIMNCDSKNVFLAMDGQHRGKVYVVDAGDYGITFQNNTLEDFLDSIFDLKDMKCTVEEITAAIKNRNLPTLRRLVEKQNGILLFKNSSYHDRFFFRTAHQVKAENILQYFLDSEFYGFDEAKKLGLIE